MLMMFERVVVASIVRVPFLSHMTMSSDATWAQASAAIWSSIELNFGIACNCMARLRPFVRAHMPKLACYLDQNNNSSSDAALDLAAAAPSREHGQNTAGDDGGAVWMGQEQSMYAFRLQNVKGNP